MMRRSIARVAPFALAFALASLLPLPAHAQGDGPLKAEDLAGGYEIVSGEKFGIPEPAERIKGTTVRFTKDRVVVMDKESKEIYGATYSLEAAEAAAGESESGATASKIKMTSKLADSEETVAYGLIDKDGETVRLIYALPGGEVPREFKTKDKQLLFVLKKTAD